jgi:hypothetical protein
MSNTDNSLNNNKNEEEEDQNDNLIIKGKCDNIQINHNNVGVELSKMAGSINDDETKSDSTILIDNHDENEKESTVKHLKMQIEILKQTQATHTAIIEKLEHNLNEFTTVRRNTKSKDQDTIADKIHHSIEYFDKFVVKDSPPTLAGAFFTFLVPILLIILGTAKWEEYNEPTSLFTTTTYFTPAARTSFPTTIKCVPRGLDVGSFQGGGSMEDMLSGSKCQSQGKTCVVSRDCCDGPGWVCSQGKCKRGGFQIKGSVFSTCQKNQNCQTSFCHPEKKICLPAHDCFGDGQTCAAAADCCSGICESGVCLPSNMLSCGKPGMKCRAASDCCGVDSSCRFEPQVSLKLCKLPKGDKESSINFGLCKDNSDCKTSLGQTCDKSNGKCQPPLGRGADSGDDKTAGGAGKTANGGGAGTGKQQGGSDGEKKVPKKGGRRRDLLEDSTSRNTNLTLASMNSSTQCFVQYTVSEACKNKMWKVNNGIVPCANNGMAPISGSGSVLLDISTGYDTLCIPLCSDEDSSIVLFGYDDLATKFIVVNDLRWAHGRGMEIGIPAKNNSVSKYKRCKMQYDSNEEDCYGWPHPVQADEEMANALAVGAIELFPSSNPTSGAKYVITRYNLTYSSPFWSSDTEGIDAKIMTEGYSQIVHYGMSSPSLKYSSTTFSSFPQNGYFIVLKSAPMYQHLTSVYNNPVLAVLAALGGFFSLVMAIFSYFKKISLKIGVRLGWICCLTKRGTKTGADYIIDVVRVKKMEKRQSNVD